ncbi:MAG: hypothetical protein Q4P17_02940 [Methanobacterium sp.]|nr:hypothetical protein [Methanobacterium sp.]
MLVITQKNYVLGLNNRGTARITRKVNGKALVGSVRFDLHPAFNYESGDELF